ncbi:MAG: hypothetical protein JRF40_00085 [Deltaproteobacteria bacterium]|nr:hypothetical protein [Deltaproteobacteria bacterium]MBW2217883.1 hypothetical protein [Deltaproteobacteria bacterium]
MAAIAKKDQYTISELAGEFDIRERINDLKLLEQDFISLGKKISARLMELEKEKNT